MAAKTYSGIDTSGWSVCGSVELCVETPVTLRVKFNVVLSLHSVLRNLKWCYHIGLYIEINIVSHTPSQTIPVKTPSVHLSLSCHQKKENNMKKYLVKWKYSWQIKQNWICDLMINYGAVLKFWCLSSFWAIIQTLVFIIYTFFPSLCFSLFFGRNELPYII